MSCNCCNRTKWRWEALIGGKTEAWGIYEQWSPDPSKHTFAVASIAELDDGSGKWGIYVGSKHRRVAWSKTRNLAMEAVERELTRGMRAEAFDRSEVERLDARMTVLATRNGDE